MARKLNYKSFLDDRGELSVIENIPFEIKRFYFIQPKEGKNRGHHRHIKTKQALFCLKGSCEVYCDNGLEINIFRIKKNEILIIDPEDWHYMFNYHKETIIGVFASETYDKDDYIDQPYIRNK